MNTTPSTNLGSLPDHVLLGVVEQLDTARDVSHLAASCRATQAAMRREGWRSWALTRFPSYRLPAEAAADWRAVVDRLTYLDRCWERRGLSFCYFRENRGDQQGRGGQQNLRRRYGGGQSVPFASVLDVCLTSSSSGSRQQDELLACGTGEDLQVRWRTLGDKSRDTWRSLAGKDAGYSEGTGDVTAVSTIERGAKAELAVGRANGDVQLLSAAFDDSFGQPTRMLLPVDDKELNLGRSMGQRAVMWTEWQPESKILASCRSTLLTLYNLSSTDVSEKELKPMLYYDVSQDAAADSRGYASMVHCVKFLSSDTVACGVSWSSEPLQWGKIRPTGIELSPPPKRARFDGCKSAVPSRATKHTVWAIEPVGTTGNLLLSAWRDGSYRLLDMRTPSDHDAAYRDTFQPYNPSSALLAYGMQRFVAAAAMEPVVRIFDFRFPKPYYHSDALPCFGQRPYPRPWRGAHGYQEPAVDGSEPTSSRRCDDDAGTRCIWHETSRNPYWRPDATLYYTKNKREEACSLAKTSDLADSFYIGTRGAFIEAQLSLAEDARGEEADTHAAPKGWTAELSKGESLVIGETCISLCEGEGWQTARPMPTVRLRRHANQPEGPQAGSRLDGRWLSKSEPREVELV
ncbi:hypothetical protein JDV02_008505 [Purpureocillium takamizusanense]|uniref:F-box domain-containing protein n=1 Tax=Purpureocillium takamizusanense TaxID=2060973 RepID=A0A9Q8VFB1_9HYPO|nr:uncharacterized protein JDV02_008505 [Purpureocillium takamizusanense]UNI22637.1 hypothetical protein JDV02_008505 [Purpureocillium takamizusanense]